MLRGKCAALFVSLAVILCACRDGRYAVVEPSVRSTDGGRTTYFSIVISTTALDATRALPTGGETGDLAETAIHHEGDFDDISIYIYNDADGRGLDGAADTPIRYARHFERADLDTLLIGNVCTFPVADYDYAPTAGDRVIVVANALDYTGAWTLGELQNIVLPRSYTEEASLADSHTFVMAPADNDAASGVILMDAAHDGSLDKPYYAKVTLERVSARIDFAVPDDVTATGVATSGSIVYPVASTASHVHVTHLRPVNVMRGGSYLFKRVTASAPADPADLAAEPQILCGRETTTADGYHTPTNYVIEPRTLGKADAAAAEPLLATWFGDSRTAAVRDNAAAFAPAYAVASLLESNGGSLLDMRLAGGTARGLVIAYADENTCHRSLQSAANITGLVIRAVYVPAVVYARYDAATATLTADASSRYAPTAADLTGTTFYRYCPQDGKEASCLYFSDRTAAEAYDAAHPDVPATITEFPEGVCYYNLWLRHAAPADGTFSCPMEYAIVRNNIYRVAVAFTGPGDPTPQVDDIPSGTLDCRIYVRKWNEITHSEIVF